MAGRDPPEDGSHAGRLALGETVEALRESLENRTEPKAEEHRDRFFITKYGGDWKPGARSNPISAEFRKLARRIGAYRKGVSCGALRHVFETVAGDSRDQIAVDRVMGHVRDEDRIRARYREAIDPNRIVDVCAFVRDRLIGGAR